jgi:hypothetical protein
VIRVCVKPRHVPNKVHCEVSEINQQDFNLVPKFYFFPFLYEFLRGLDTQTYHELNKMHIMNFPGGLRKKHFQGYESPTVQPAV